MPTRLLTFIAGVQSLLLLVHGIVCFTWLDFAAGFDGGQLFPSTWLTRRIHRRSTYGRQTLNGFTGYTSCGASTSGSPLRVDTTPEIVLLRFQ